MENSTPVHGSVDVHLKERSQWYGGKVKALQILRFLSSCDVSFKAVRTILSTKHSLYVSGKPQLIEAETCREGVPWVIFNFSH